MRRSMLLVLCGGLALIVAVVTSTSNRLDAIPGTNPSPLATRVQVEQSSSARELLGAVALQSQLIAPIPYDRDDYSPGGWADTDGDCQSDRHEVLIAESLVQPTLSANGCRVEHGLWVDPFDGRQYSRADEVTIDHLVPLSVGHRSGAWAWDLESKQRFAHDTGLDGALGVVGPAINQAKGNRGPDQWKPPLRSAWCSYATDWIRVKLRWDLAFTIDEAAALVEMLDTCVIEARYPTQRAHPVPALPIVEPQPTPVEISATATIAIGDCDARAEIVTLENRGVTTVSLDGWVLHDRGQNHTFALDGLRIYSGGRLLIVSGQQAVVEDAAVLWKPENVWNNSGDTATLLGPNSMLVSIYDC